MPGLMTGSGYALTQFAAAYALIALVCRPRTYHPGHSCQIRIGSAAPAVVLRYGLHAQRAIKKGALAG